MQSIIAVQRLTASGEPASYNGSTRDKANEPPRPKPMATAQNSGAKVGTKVIIARLTDATRPQATNKP
ncbi:hypothetical protein D3C80_1200640 [compost metagenome]